MLVYAKVRHVEVAVVFNCRLQEARKVVVLGELGEDGCGQEALPCLRATDDYQEGAAIAGVACVGSQEQVHLCKGARRLPETSHLQVLELLLDERHHSCLMFLKQQFLAVSLACPVAQGELHRQAQELRV